MGQKNRRDSRGRFAQPIVSPMNPEPNPPKLVSVSIKNLKDNPPGVVVEETDISSTNQTFGQNLGAALDQALLTNNETDSKETLNNKTKEVTMSKEEVKNNEVVETTNNATTTEAAPKKETAKAAPQKKAEEKKAEAAPAEAPAAAPAKQEAPKAEAPIASGDTKGTAKQDLRKALQDETKVTSREVVIREEFDTGRAMLHNFGVGLAIGGGVVLGAALASGVVYLVKRQFSSGDEVTE